MAGLPREIVKWIQGLDLSYSIKNVRRDFANGFLVAEMSARYHPTEVQMHSFDNGLGLKTKLDNWAQLEKFFKKKSLRITRKMIDDVINNKPNAVVPVIQEVYTLLTERVIQKVKPSLATEVPIPHFARPTHAALERDDGRSEMYQFVKEQSPQQRREYIAERGTQHLAARSLHAQEQMLGRTMSHRSASKNSSVIDASSDLLSAHPPLSTMRTSRAQVQLNDEVNQIVEACMDGQDESLLENEKRKEFITSFVTMMEDIPSGVVEAVFTTIAERLPFFVETMIQDPKQFWKFVSIFSDVFDLPEKSEGFSRVVSMLKQLGQTMLTKDHNTTWSLFEDYALPKLCRFLQHYPFKRSAILDIVYSFCTPDPDIHMSVIKSLQEHISDSNAFILCLSCLIKYEKDFSEDLLDLYVYYCVMGFSSTSPSLRATSLSMLPVIIDHNDQLVLQMIDRIADLTDDHWWDVHAQLLTISAKLLAYCESPEQSDESEKLLHIINTVLEEAHSPHIKTLALSCLAPRLKQYPSLCNLFTNLLMELPEDERISLLEQPADRIDTLQIGSSCSHDVASITFHWNGLGVANSFARFILERQFETLRASHLEILNSCITTANTGHSSEDEMLGWTLVFENLQNHLFAGLCDGDICEISCRVLLMFFKMLKFNVLQSMPLLFRALEVIFQPRSKGEYGRCREVVPMFLISLYDIGDPFVQPLQKLAASMSEHSLQQTPIADFLDHVHYQYA